MTVSRRWLFQSLAIAGVAGSGTEAPGAEISLDALRSVSEAHGVGLSDDRLRVLQPVLEARLPQLQSLRDFPIDEIIAPTQGILDK
ncbi:MAG: hypothetical protein ABJF23_11645 [Bryobacteraceae bacterium]